MEKTNKLMFDEWLDKYFEKDDDHNYYTWTFTDDGMHPNDKSRWKDDDLLHEYDRYLTDNEESHVGLDDYEE